MSKFLTPIFVLVMLGGLFTIFVMQTNKDKSAIATLAPVDVTAPAAAPAAHP